MTQSEYGVTLTHKLEGPTYQDGQWIASVELRGIEPKTFHGATQKDVQIQMLEYLDQIVQELERVHTSLGMLLGSSSEYQKESE